MNIIESPSNLNTNKLFWIRILIFCGVLSSLHYFAINIYVPLQDPSYSIAAMTVSELSAVDAVTRDLWTLLVIPYSIFILAFGTGILLIADESRSLHIIGKLTIFDGIIGFFWPPMHLREVIAAGGGTITDTMHIVFAATTSMIFILTLIFGATSFGKSFRYFSFSILFILLIFGILTSLDSPKLSENLPTPNIGIWERINIGVYLLWVIAFSIMLQNKVTLIKEKYYWHTKINFQNKI
jgi:hypothetical protein